MEKTLKATFEIDISNAIKSINNIQQNIKEMISSLSGTNIDKQKSLEFKNLTASSKQFTRSLKENVKSIHELAKTKINPKEIIPKKLNLKAPKISKAPEKTNQSANSNGFGMVDAVSLVAMQKITSGLISIGKQAVSTQAKISTVGNVLKTVFAGASGEMNKFINTSANALGIGKQTAKEMATGYGIMLKDVGLSVGKTEKLTERLMEASSILAANTGHDMATVTDSIKSGLMGNTIAMDKLGIELKQASLQTTEAFKNIAKGKKFSELTFETQSLITAMAILEKTTKAYGDTIGDTANSRLLSLSANLENAKNNMMEIIGDALKPLTMITANFAYYLSVLTEALKNLSPETKQIIFIGTAVIAIIPMIISAIGILIKWMNFLKSTIASVGGIFGQFGKILSTKFLAVFAVVIIGLAIISEAFGGLANAINNIGQVIKASLIYTAGSILYVIGTIIGIFTGGKSALKDLGRELMATAGGIANSVKRSGNSMRGTKDASKIQQKAMDGATKANNKNAKSADKAAKANKNLKDNLQGFDEINKITPDETGGAGDTAIPNMDMGGADIGGLDALVDQLKPATNMLDNVKDKLNTFKDKIQKLIPWITTLAVTFGTLKFINLIKGFFTSGKGVLSFISNLKNLDLSFTAIMGAIKGFGLSALGLIQTLSAVLIPITALGLTIYGITKNLNEGNIAMADGVAGLGALGTAVAVAAGAMMLGIGPVVGIIAGLVAGIGILIGSWIGHNKKCEEVKNSLTDVEGANRMVEEATKSYTDAVDSNINAIDRAEEAHNRLIEAEEKNGISGADLEMQVAKGTLTYKDMNAQQKEVYKAYIANDKAQKKVEESTNQLKEATDVMNKSQLEQKLRTLASAGSWDEYRDTLIKASKDGIINTDELKDKLEQACTKMDESGRKTFVENLPENIRDGIDPNKYDTRSFSNHFENVCNNIGTAFKKVFDKIKNWWANLRLNKTANVNANTGGNGGGSGGGRGYPAMATGGVVSGATLALVGEGQYDEAVIPLGSSPQFQSMKEEIAEAVISSLPHGGGANNGVHKIEIDILAGGKYMQKQYIDLSKGLEEYAW